MLINCPRGWFFGGFPPAGVGTAVPPDCAGAGVGAGAGALARLMGGAGLTGRACKRLR